MLRTNGACPLPKRLRVEFQEIDSPAGAGYTLHAAAWGDGSRAVLDSRGMLHLRSSQAAIPELTLVLCTGAWPVGARTADGSAPPISSANTCPRRPRRFTKKSSNHLRPCCYRDRLDRPDEAARCLEQGGLWTEAIALYEELGEHEKAGDLYRQLDQPDPARQAYRAAVAKYLAQNDCLAAARVLEEQARRARRGIAQLDAGWPSSGQAGACLEGLLGLLARLAGTRRPRPGSSSSGGNRCSRGKRSCSLTFSPKPRPRIPMRRLPPRLPTRPGRWPALDWAGLSGEEQQRLLEAVRRLVPADRLLGRDCQRFLRPPARPAAPPRTTCDGTSCGDAGRLAADPIEAHRLHRAIRSRCSGKPPRRPETSAMRPVTRAGRWSWSRCSGTARHVRLDAGPWDRLPLARRPILLAPDPRATAAGGRVGRDVPGVSHGGPRIRLEADCPGSKVEPLAVLDTADPNQFAVFGADSAIRLYRCLTDERAGVATFALQRKPGLCVTQAWQCLRVKMDGLRRPGGRRERRQRGDDRTGSGTTLALAAAGSRARWAIGIGATGEVDLSSPAANYSN